MKEKIKNLSSFIRKYIRETILLIGVGVFTYSIFNFSYKTHTGPCLPRPIDCSEIQGAVYYYSDVTLLLIAIGGILIVLGVLMIINGQHEKKN